MLTIAGQAVRGVAPTARRIVATAENLRKPAVAVQGMFGEDERPPAEVTVPVDPGGGTAQPLTGAVRHAGLDAGLHRRRPVGVHLW